jgi:cytochrome c5
MKRFIAPLGLMLLLAANGVAADGRATYTQICRACHATGVAGAPVVGDRAAWAGRLPKGIDALLESALRGKGGMPPKGGYAGLSDAQVRDAVEYIIAQSQ